MNQTVENKTGCALTVWFIYLRSRGPKHLGEISSRCCGETPEKTATRFVTKWHAMEADRISARQIYIMPRHALCTCRDFTSNSWCKLYGNSQNREILGGSRHANLFIVLKIHLGAWHISTFLGKPSNQEILDTSLHRQTPGKFLRIEWEILENRTNIFEGFTHATECRIFDLSNPTQSADLS